MKLLVGLGNPGEKYKNNRHNAGYRLAKFLVSNFQPPIRDQFLVFETGCFMNDSGNFVKKILEAKSLPLSVLYIAHDDLDIPLGKYKIQFGKGPKAHKGVESVEKVLGTNQFWRIRIGTDARNSQHRIGGEDYVLQDFSKEEQEVLEKVFREIMRRLERNFTG